MATNKAVVATVCVVVSIGAIVGGVYLRSSTAPLAMPTNIDEALAGLKSDAYERMDDQRRQQYAAEAMRLFGELSDEERRAMRDQFQDDEDMRDAMRKAFEDRFEDMVRKAARGEGMDMPMFRPRGGGERPNPDEMTDEQREERESRREQMRERIAEQLKDNWESGDAQSSGLRQEFFSNRGGGGGGGRRGGGGR